MGRRGCAAALAAASLVGGGLTAFFIGRRFAGWGYLERDEDLLVRRGVMVSRLSVVPYGRMQFVDVIAGPLRAVVRARDGEAPHRRGRQ